MMISLETMAGQLFEWVGVWMGAIVGAFILIIKSNESNVNGNIVRIVFLHIGKSNGHLKSSNANAG